MKKAVPGAALFRVILTLVVASLACGNPIQSYFSTRASNRETATAAMFTATATETNTRRPTRTSTPSVTHTQTRTKTRTLAPTQTPLPIGTLTEGTGTLPAPDKRTLTKTGPSGLSVNRFIETAGLTKFSYFPPSGWKKVTGSGGNLTSWEEPAQSASAVPTLLFSVEKSDKSAAEAVKEMTGTLTQGSGVKIISQGKFTNDAGLDAYKIVFILSSQGDNIQIVFYFFQKRGYLVEGGYVRPMDQNKELDPIVDQCLKTVQYE